jgi:uncharacterized delta-60 repeat protein
MKGMRRGAPALGVAASLAMVAVAGSPLLAASGDLDPGFGGGSHGRVEFNLGFVTDVVAQPGGGIVTVGSAVGAGTGSDAVAARFHADGTRDFRFGTVKLPGPTEANEAALAAVAQPDGKVVVVGTVTDGGNRADFGVWRLRPSGELDRSFSGDGFAQIGDPSTGDEAFGVALDGQGRIVVAGTRVVGADSDMAVVRLTKGGARDNTFNNGESLLVVPHAGFDLASAVAVQSDGRIVLGGFHQGLVGSVVVRISPGAASAAAVLDVGFDGDGIADIPGTTDSNGADVAVGPHGKIFVLAEAPAPGGPAGSTDATVVRLTSTGAVDASFGAANGTGAHIDLNDGVGSADALTLLPRGGVAVAGGTKISDPRAFVAKFRAGGAPDPAMGPGGVKTLAKGATGYGVAALSDGRIITAGDLAPTDDHANFVYRLIGDLRPRTCAGKVATITGTKAPDKLVGTRRPDVVAGLGGGDTITGLGRGDIVCGGKGADRITGRAGNDRLYGQAGRDTLSGGTGDDQLVGGAGRDKLRGGPGHDTRRQ